MLITNPLAFDPLVYVTLIHISLDTSIISTSCISNVPVYWKYVIFSCHSMKTYKM